MYASAFTVSALASLAFLINGAVAAPQFGEVTIGSAIVKVENNRAAVRTINVPLVKPFKISTVTGLILDSALEAPVERVICQAYQKEDGTEPVGEPFFKGKPTRQGLGGKVQSIVCKQKPITEKN
jgi:hypothetical protein